MSALIVYDETRGVPVLDSRVAARELGVEHRSIVKLIQEHAEDFEKVAFKMLPSEESLTGQNEKVAVLDEEQSLLLITMVRNTEKSLAAKKELIRQFMAMRNRIAEIKAADLRKMMSRIDAMAESLYEQITWSYTRISHSDPVNKELLERGEQSIKHLETILCNIKKRELPE